MELSIRQKSNIRYFVYYLVNGTLNFDLLNDRLSTDYHEYLKHNPQLFYSTCCVFINQEVENNPDWPDTTRLGRFIYQQIEPADPENKIVFMDWEIEQGNNTASLKDSFKAFVYWFSIIQSTRPFLESINYSELISSGASFVEQCFAIWANVIDIENNQVKNAHHARQRVQEYIKQYHTPGYQANLEEWEYNLW